MEKNHQWQYSMFYTVANLEMQSLLKIKPQPDTFAKFD